MGLNVFHRISVDNSHIQTECGIYMGLFCGILTVPHNIIMDLNNVLELQGYINSILIAIDVNLVHP